MQLCHILRTLAFALCCADTVGGRRIPQREQNSGISATSTSIERTATHALTGSSITTTKDFPTSAVQSTGLSAGTSSDAQGTEGTKGDPPTNEPTFTTLHGTTSSTRHATSSPTSAWKDVQLPIQPSITPALGIVGVILIATGAVYTIIGIKHHKLLVVLSTTYLASLGVTVLVIYVMTPPISNAIQGAYVVAAVITGLIFGAVALIFKEMTEGLGCLLGGFCMAMWLLTLRPGGLISSTNGRAIMIGVFSALAWSLSFSRYTRNYGTIICTSFAGAVITILGIDCFSCAGLKEFWLYIWNLNPNEFPIHTTTYPISRGILVETACTILLFVFGVISQLKVWKMVKDRRAKKEAGRLEGESHRDQRDSRVGEEIEASNSRALAEWEAIYGEKDSSGDATSATSTNSLKKSTIAIVRELDSVEMADNCTTKDASASVTVCAASDDGIPPLRPRELVWRKLSSDFTVVSSSQEMRMQAAPGPEIVPLPFLPPVQHDYTRYENGSATSTGASEMVLHENWGPVRLDRTALEKIGEQAPAEFPRLEDDAASSVAATADDEIFEEDGLSGIRLSGFASTHAQEDLRPSERDVQDRSAPQTLEEALAEAPIDEQDDEMLIPLPIVPAKSKMRAVDKGLLKVTMPNLPQSMSKVAMAYRTNEWAKHVAHAPQPEVGESPEADEPGVQVAVGRQEEEPRPVDPAALLETGLETEPAFISAPKSTRSGRGAPGLSSRPSGATPLHSIPRDNSNASIRRSGSNPFILPKREVRHWVAPLARNPLVASPVEEVVAPAELSRDISTPAFSTTTLLDERNRLLSLKPTSICFNPLPDVNSVSPSESASACADPLAGNDANNTSVKIEVDSLTLAQRKALLDRGQIQPSAPKETHRESHQRSASTPQPKPVHFRVDSILSHRTIHDCHPAHRTNTVDTDKQTAMLTQWRQSLQQRDHYSNGGVEEQARQAMMHHRQLKDYEEAKQKAERARMENRMDMAMRTGQLTNAHQNALRKMQAQANDAAR